jgi:tetratricopeptide (TPR) repeat protein
MFFRTGSLFCLLLALPLLTEGAEAEAWSNARYGVVIDAFPQGWSVHRAETQVRLDKEYNKDGYGYAYNESMTVSISLGTNSSLADAASEMEGQGYILQERSRVRFGQGTVPLWIFFQQTNAQEVRWVALVIRSGLAYSFEIRGTPLDTTLLTDFRALIGAFHFLADARQEAWNAIESQDPGRAQTLFKKMVQAQAADGNALYGLGLAELALGQSKDALAHLKQADAIIGLGEARQALGQAYLQTGDPLRAATIWYQMLVDEPDREDEVQPYLDDALAQARVSDHALTNEHRLVWEDFAFLGALVSIDLQDILPDARSNQFDRSTLPIYEKLSGRCNLLFTETLRHLMVDGGSQVETHYLEGSFHICQAIAEAQTALQESSLEHMEHAELRLTEGLELMQAATPLPEAQP